MNGDMAMEDSKEGEDNVLDDAEDNEEEADESGAVEDTAIASEEAEVFVKEKMPLLLLMEFNEEKADVTDSEEKEQANEEAFEKTISFWLLGLAFNEGEKEAAEEEELDRMLLSVALKLMGAKA